MNRVPDKKVTVSIDAGLLALVDKYVERHSQITRSAVFEEALHGWYRQQLDQADRDYYLSLTPEEKASDQSWNEIMTSTAEQIWK